MLVGQRVVTSSTKSTSTPSPRMLVLVLGGTALCGALHALTDLLCTSRSWLPSPTAKERSLAVQSAVNVIILIFVFGLYVAALFGPSNWKTTMFDDADAAVVQRTFASSDSLDAGLSLNLALVLYETSLYLYFGKTLAEFAHHVLGVVVVSLSLRSGHLGYFVAWAGLAEFTNVPLSVLYVMNTANLKDHPLYVPNGILLWMGFLTTRIISLAVCAWRLSRDLFVTLPALSKLEQLDPALRYLLLPSNLFLWALSVMWFRKITHGMLKALGTMGKKAK